MVMPAMQVVTNSAFGRDLANSNSLENVRDLRFVDVLKLSYITYIAYITYITFGKSSCLLTFRGASLA